LRDLPLEGADHRRRRQLGGGDRVQPVARGRHRFAQRLHLAGQRPKPKQLVPRRLPQNKIHPPAELAQHCRVDRVVLTALQDGLGEMVRGPLFAARGRLGVDHHHRDPGRRQLAGQIGEVDPGRFQHDPHRPLAPAQRFDQLAAVGRSVLAFRQRQSFTDHHQFAGRDIDTDNLVTGHGDLICFTIQSGPPTLHHRRPALYTGSWWALGYSSASTSRAGGRSSNRIILTDVLGTQRPPGPPQ